MTERGSLLPDLESESEPEPEPGPEPEQDAEPRVDSGAPGVPGVFKTITLIRFKECDMAGNAVDLDGLMDF